MKKERGSFILSLAVVALIAIFLISLISNQIEIREKEQELQEANTVLQEISDENEELAQISEETDEETYMERIARELLGYVLPGETVYYDTSAEK